MAKECGEFNSDSVYEKSVKPVAAPATSEFARFAEQSRARWDIIEWLKVKIRQLSGRRTPTPKT